MMLVKGRLVYFGASGAPAVDYMRSLPAAHTSGLSYQPNLNEVVRLGIGFGSILLPLAAYCVVHEVGALATWAAVVISTRMPSKAAALGPADRAQPHLARRSQPLWTLNRSAPPA
jgi:hypothetical protein